MPHEHLGLFDTPPSQRETRAALMATAVLVAAFLLILPLGDIPVGEVVAFVPVIDAVVCVGELIIATMLFAQAAVFRSRSLALLAAGFVFIATMLIGHALTFPGAFAPDGLFGADTNSTAWAMIFRRMGFPLVVIGYALLMRAEAEQGDIAERPDVSVLVWVLPAVALAGAATLISIDHDNLLPPMFVNRSDAQIFNLTVYNLANIALLVAAMTVLYLKQKSVLDIWLQVALAGWLIQFLLNLSLEARFTVGWYSLFVIVLVSHLFVLLALIGESNRLYARLALAKAVGNRERDSRMMSMDAVAAAITHEVGQPLAAISLSASAGLSSLERKEGSPEAAKKALRDTIDAVHRAFAVLKNVRATFAGGSGAVSEFSVNDLLRETVSQLAGELGAHHISLRLSLEAEPSEILADRVQLQRVLMNLLTNAIEALNGPGRRVRRIEVRTASPDSQHILIEISDSGAGIPAEQMGHIFEPFFTTKSTGTGLGLSLSRTIVEEHGGKLWASFGNESGMTFHVQLRRISIAPSAEQRTA